MKDIWPADPDGDMTPILELSVDLVNTMKEAAMARHPSGGGFTPAPILKASDRCDRCGAAAMYRVWREDIGDLDYCQHHWTKYMPAMADQGWRVVGTNPDLINELYGGD